MQHSFGWPLDNKTGGGSFLYHYGDNLVAVGFVVHLNYENPYLSPYEEFQRFKTHDAIRDTFEGGKRIAYGARAITEGGWQSIPKLVFPGGALIGCSAGFVNVPRIKGIAQRHPVGHAGGRARLRGDRRRAARTTRSRPTRTPFWHSDIARDLKKVRNAKPLWSRFGTWLGIPLGGLDMWLNTLFPFLGHTLKHKKTDAAATQRAAQYQPIAYPKPDGVLTFDRLTNVSFSATNHEEDQPVHLRLTDPKIPDRGQSAGVGGAGAALLPGAGLRGHHGDRRLQALPDQRAELRALQDLRHQGPQPEHHLGLPRGRRRSELRGDVRDGIGPTASEANRWGASGALMTSKSMDGLRERDRASREEDHQSRA